MTQFAKETTKGRALDAGSSGVFAHAQIHIEANVVDGETVTISSDVYEFDDDAAVTAGNILVDVTGTLTPPDATDALIAAINASGIEPVSAIDLGTTDILLVSDKALDLDIALAHTLGGANATIDAVMRGGVLGNVIDKVRVFSIAPTAEEVLHGTIYIPVDFVPVGAFVQVVITATGIAVAWVGAVTLDLTNNIVKVDNTGATDWAVTDTVRVLVF